MADTVTRSKRRVARLAAQIAPTELSHLGTACTAAAAKSKSPDDIVVVSAVRTPIGRAKKGAFKDTHPTDLLIPVLQAVTDRVGLDKGLVGDIIVGNVLAPGGFAGQARMAMLLAGFPEHVPVTTCNRQCASGLQAFAHVAAAINMGYYDIGIAAGIESMSAGDMMGSVGEPNPKVFGHPVAKLCLNTMGQTSENVAARFHVSREAQDAMAAESNARALRAQAEGHFKAEIVPVTMSVEKADGTTGETTVAEDEGPRASTPADLAKLKPAFKPGGSTTAGNASQVSDGAAAVLVMKRSRAQALGLKPLGTFRSFDVVGVAPDIMGVGPAAAIPIALRKAGITVPDVDMFEVNEAFASQCRYCADELHIPPEKLNPSGGAIALGHPLGCTGARQIATLLHGLRRTGGRYGVVSMCIGTGMGAAAVFESD